MRNEPLKIEDVTANRERHLVLRLSGPLVISNLFEFQTLVRGNTSPSLILDFTEVPYIDSAGIGALVGAYVTHQRDGRSLVLVGVGERLRHALQITQVDHFFTYYVTLTEVI